MSLAAFGISHRHFNVIKAPAVAQDGFVGFGERERREAGNCEQFAPSHWRAISQADLQSSTGDGFNRWSGEHFQVILIGTRLAGSRVLNRQVKGPGASLPRIESRCVLPLMGINVTSSNVCIGSASPMQRSAGRQLRILDLRLAPNFDVRIGVFP